MVIYHPSLKITFQGADHGIPATKNALMCYIIQFPYFKITFLGAVEKWPAPYIYLMHAKKKKINF